MVSEHSFKLSEVARRLDVPQHQLIHLCEKDVVVPEVQDAQGRGSSRVFSSRNVLEIAIALRLRAAMLPVAAVGAVIRVLRAFEARLERDMSGFSLPHSLREEEAPDLRVIVSDGSTIYFSLGDGSVKPKLFGGISLDQVTGDRPGTGATRPVRSSAHGDASAFGGPERSQFVRLELSVTEVARSLPID
jgi:DNA-binding transcriptional MerR regulator